MERESFKEKLIKGIALVVAVSVAVNGGILFAQRHQLERKQVKLEQEARDYYAFQNMEALDFLTEDLVRTYKKTVIDACEAYDLVGLSHVYVLGDTLVHDPDTNMCQWDVLCDDSKATGFVSVFKKTNETFTVERKYDEIDRKALLASLRRGGSGGEVTFADAGQGTEATEAEAPERTASLGRVDTGFETQIGGIVYPPDCSFTATEEQRAKFEKKIKEYLAAQGVDSVEEILFKEYVAKEPKRADMIFLLRGTRPADYEEIQCEATAEGFVFSLNF